MFRHRLLTRDADAHYESADQTPSAFLSALPNSSLRPHRRRARGVSPGARPARRLHASPAFHSRSARPSFASKMAGRSRALPQSFETRHPLAFVERFAFADERQGKVRQRRQIPARADRTFFRYHRMQTPRLSSSHSSSMTSNRIPLNPSVSTLARSSIIARTSGSESGCQFRKRGCGQGSIGVGAVPLRDLDIGQFAETGADTINHPAPRDDFFDRFARGENTRPRRRRDRHTLVTNCDCSDLLQSERLTVQLHLRSLVEKNSLGRELLTHA